jgi:hypothetical protein
MGDLMALTAIRIPEWVHLKAAHVLSQFSKAHSPLPYARLREFEPQG